MDDQHAADCKTWEWVGGERSVNQTKPCTMENRWLKEQMAAQQNAQKGYEQDTPVEAPVNSQIREGVGYLEKQIAETHAVISALESRLETVLTPVPPQVTGNGGEKTGPGIPKSDLFIRLKSLSHGLQEVQDRMHRLLGRIEV